MEEQWVHDHSHPVAPERIPWEAVAWDCSCMTAEGPGGASQNGGTCTHSTALWAIHCQRVSAPRGKVDFWGWSGIFLNLFTFSIIVVLTVWYFSQSMLSSPQHFRKWSCMDLTTWMRMTCPIAKSHPADQGTVQWGNALPPSWTTGMWYDHHYGILFLAVIHLPC